MKIKQNPRGEIMVLELSGKIMGGPDFDKFKGEIAQLIENEELDECRVGQRRFADVGEPRSIIRLLLDELRGCCVARGVRGAAGNGRADRRAAGRVDARHRRRGGGVAAEQRAAHAAPRLTCDRARR